MIGRLQPEFFAHFTYDCATWPRPKLTVVGVPGARAIRAASAGSLLPASGSFELPGGAATEECFGLCALQQIAPNVTHEGAYVDASGNRRLDDAADGVDLFGVEVRTFR